jgi:shikimate kinase
MSGQSSIFLVGPMGSGKTAVGRSLARLLGYPFFDSDHEVEARSGAEITLIFEREGEGGFRRREREVIGELVRRERIVLATGGGAVLDPENRRDLRAHGWVAYLEASVAQQSERAGRTRHRPLLQGATDPTQRLAELMQVREPLYREVADLVVATDHRRVQWVAEHIVAHYLSAPAHRKGSAAR